MWFIGAMTFPHLTARAETLARELDLSPPAAEWVALAALHAGCFLRSQYCKYSGHSREAARLFVGSLMERRLAAEHDAGPLGLLCRLTSKAVYRALGEPGDPVPAAAVASVGGARRTGVRTGNWLTLPQAQQLLEAPAPATRKGLRGRTVPMPSWAKVALDRWAAAASAVDTQLAHELRERSP